MVMQLQRLRRIPVCQICLGFIMGVVTTVILSNDQLPRQCVSRMGSRIREAGDVDRLRSLHDKPHDDDNYQNGQNAQMSDVTSVADELRKKVRLLCWVVTSEEHLETRAAHVKKTWGKRCDVLLFASDRENETYGTMPIHVTPGYDYLPLKVRTALDHIYTHYRDDADWFVKCDDDTYLIVENLRYFLSSQNTSEAVYFGHSLFPPAAYNSGGAGYVFSREALKRFGEGWQKLAIICSGLFSTVEDVMIGECMRKLGVSVGDTRDALNRSRFHCFQPVQHIIGHYQLWYSQYDFYGARYGIDWMSDYPISFHYITPDMMYNMEYFLYHARPYGLMRGLPDLNKRSTMINK